MKYIRTKEYGVCKVTNEDKHTLSYENSYICGCLWKDDYKDRIQYADTIEELCDGFIFKDINANELHFLDKNSGISLLGASLFKETLRGFIETNKGLIYVAKMNDKGELELL